MASPSLLPKVNSSVKMRVSQGDELICSDSHPLAKPSFLSSAVWSWYSVSPEAGFLAELQTQLTCQGSANCRLRSSQFVLPLPGRGVQPENRTGERLWWSERSCKAAKWNGGVSGRRRSGANLWNLPTAGPAVTEMVPVTQQSSQLVATPQWLTAWLKSWFWTHGCPWGELGRRESEEVWDGHIYTLLCLTRITNKDLWRSTWHSA